MMYSTKQVDAALRNFMRWLDTDGTKQALEDMIATGEVEVAAIIDGAFAFAKTPGDDGETS